MALQNTSMSPAASRVEAERQLAAATERYREAVSSMREGGRSEAGQHVAIKVVGRALHLVWFALKHTRRPPRYRSSDSSN